MKKLSFFLMAMLMSVMSFAQTAETVTMNLAEGVHDGSQITWTELNGSITITQMKGTSQTAVSANYIAAPRLYKGHILSFECVDNYTITAIKINYNGTYCGNTILVGNTQTDNVVTNNTDLFTGNFATAQNGSHEITTTNVAGESKILIQNSASASNVQLRPKSIEISYIKAATSEPTITCGDIVFKASDAKNKEVEVIGENLTEAIVATLKTGTNFAVEGTLTATGGTLTISVTATESGEYSDVLVLTAGEIIKEVNVTATVIKMDGDGTEENPYSVADVIALANPGVKAWVEGYIVGSMNNNKLEETPTNATNIALAGTADDTENIVPVQLPSGNIRTALNVVDNPSNLGAKVAIYGTLEAYFSRPGVKNISDYEILSTITPEPVEYTVTATAENGTVEGAGTYEEGAVVTLTATPAEGYEFVNWTSGETEVSTANPFTFTVTSDTTLVANFKEVVVEPTEVTVYCINSSKWDVVACHHWVEGGSTTSWPGDEMTKTGETVNGFDVYAATFTIEHTSCIFNNNGNGSQTGNLTVANGHYYYVKDSKWYASLADVPALDPLATDVYLAGDMNGWSTVANEFKKATEDATTASLAFALEAATTYQFKVVKEGAWLGNYGTITESVEGWTFSADISKNCQLTTAAAGEYVLTWDLNTDKLSVTYPEIPTYTVTLLNDAGAELEGAGEYVEGSVATVIAPEMDGWYFVAWTDEEGMVISNDATTTVTVNQDITLTALYAMMMPLEVSDLEIIMDPVVGLIGSTDLGGGTLSLQLVVDAYAEPGEDGEFPLTEDSQIWLGEEMQFEFLEGIAFIDLENNTAQAIVLAADEWGMIYYFVIEMSAAAPAEPIVVVVENATLDDQVESTGFFYMAGECTIDGVIYPVKAEIPSLDKTIAEAEYEYVMVEVGTWGGEYLGNATGTATVSIVDNVVILTGVIENPMTHVAFDVTISGTLPAEEPEGPATGLDNINTTVAPVKAIVNGQLVIVKDGVKYNVQGAVL